MHDPWENPAHGGTFLWIEANFLIGLCKTGMPLRFCHGCICFYPKVNVDLLLFYSSWNMPP